MHTDKFPAAHPETGAVHFWFESDGLPAAGHVTRRCLQKLGCADDSAHQAVTTYFRHKKLVDAAARAKRLAGEDPVVDDL